MKDKTQPKPSAKPKLNKAVTPSEKLASLLRNEMMCVARAKKAEADLKSVRDAIKAAWNERERLNNDTGNEDHLH